MKRFALATAAALMMIGPMAGAAHAQAPRQDSRGYDNNRNDRNDRNVRNTRNDRRDANRWDQRQHNGYYVNGRWHYGQPTASIQARRDYRAGYQQWRRGDRLPSNYRAHYRTVDYRREHLRAPPRGYQYVRTDRGETLLVGIATGVILGLILSN